MASYKKHNLFNLIFILPLSLIGFYLFTHLSKHQLGLFSAGFTYATLFMSPDLDLVHKINILSLRGILSIPFRLYSMVFRHRGVSHHIVFGTLSRVLWIFLWLLGIGLLANLPSLSITSLVEKFISYKEIILMILLGVLLADIGHLVLDSFYDKK